MSKSVTAFRDRYGQLHATEAEADYAEAFAAVLSIVETHFGGMPHAVLTGTKLVLDGLLRRHPDEVARAVKHSREMAGGR